MKDAILGFAKKPVAGASAYIPIDTNEFVCLFPDRVGVYKNIPGTEIRFDMDV